MDILRLPVAGRFLRWRHARTTLQLALLTIAVALVVHGFVGPDIGSANLSTVLTWVHYRGLLVVALLAAGNFFCAGCPFIRVRDWGRRLHTPSLVWPARLRGKWMAAALVVAVLFAYELFDLWSLPRATAWLVLAYFVGALVVDLLFRGATFCKHLCPVGQFNFVASTMSPLELRIRDRPTCDACRTSDCISGRRSPTQPTVTVQRGCELGLFLPVKVGNIDCTFCLDCVQACPHDNIALGSRVPGEELADDARRSGIGRLTQRADLAVLAAIFTFGAWLNAFAMTAPAYRVEAWLAGAMGGASGAASLGAMFTLGLGVSPVVVLAGAAALTRALTGSTLSLAAVAQRFVFSLVPVGFGMWVAHYGFHLLTGLFVVVPVTQSAAIDLLGWPALGLPLWQWTGMRPGAVFPIQLGVLLLGALGSVAVVQAIARRDHPARAGRAAAVWGALVGLLVLAAVWVLFQPMEMRGMGL